MIRILYAIVVAVLALVPGCSCKCDCSDEMKDARKKYGQPEEITTYSSGGYASVKYWWWTRGLNKSFTWGRHVSGCCDVSTYTFDPIGKGTAVDPDTLTLTLVHEETEVWRMP